MGSGDGIFERCGTEKPGAPPGFARTAIGLSLDREANLPQGPLLKRGGPTGPLFFFTRFTGL
ncbi:hypothetical protein V475_13550 [Sphingobium baderi LL03]|uniref:Uncharacterized protein n=1 Tax=Sphingobium baderi LL03 TaxID=1114964 RepID=T0G684_9SPHN|nr:hypothetical protein L485_16895 [Sphingobium baderi LL03]KMS61566.1 hypothetical protein V475_13550 [Sphingobium baderi LL03]